MLIFDHNALNKLEEKIIANILIEESVNIYELPTSDRAHPCNAHAQITIGDLHANAIKLIFLMIKQGIATNISQKEYAELVRIYLLSANALTPNDLHSFNTILNRLKFSSNATLRLIGDELADRGSNDYFILKILETLRKNDVPVEILLSNHGVEFIAASEMGQFTPILLDANDHASSMKNLNVLIQRGLVTKEEVQHLSSTAYKPTLKAISYTLNEDKSCISVYSHAAIDVNVIAMIAKKLNVPFNDNTAQELAYTIDGINLQFQQYVQNNSVHQLCSDEAMWRGYNGEILSPTVSPFEFLMWNRMADLATNQKRNHTTLQLLI